MTMSATPSNKRASLRVTSLRHDIDPDVVLDVVAALPGAALPATVTLSIEGLDKPNPHIVVTEDERTHTTDLVSLTDLANRKAPSPTTNEIEKVVCDWVAKRPVSDRSALTNGFATLGWCHGEERTKWRVVVARSDRSALEWVPATTTDAITARRIRDEAFSRSQDKPLNPIRVGNVFMFEDLACTALSSAVLTNPLLAMSLGNVVDPWVVATPGLPVLVAERDDADRLAAETVESHLLVPLATFTTLGWS